MSCNMKVLAIIMSGLVLQTSASFFDGIRGAVTTVESSFEKLLTDVIYDVKDTIDCTLMAVEQVLALGVFRDPSDYDRTCGGGRQVTEQPFVAAAAEPALPPAPETSQYTAISLTKTEDTQVDSSVSHEDQVLCDTYTQLENVKLALINETDRLTEIDELLKKQLEDFSAEVNEKLKGIELQTSEPTVERIWNEIELLHEIEHRHKNTDEAMKISHILDQILNILDASEDDRSAADDYKVQEIKRKLSRQSKGKDSDTWKDTKDYPKDFRDYAKRVFNENKAVLPDDNTAKKSESDDKDKQSVTNKKGESDKNDVDNINEKNQEVTTVRKPARTTTATTEKPFSIEEMASEYGSLFDIVPDIDSIETKKAVESAKAIIEDTRLNNAVMKSFAKMSSSKEARDLFDYSYLFPSGR